MAGLFCGILLRRLGFAVEIYERSSEALASRGAGIATHDELYAAFRQAGVPLDRAFGVESAGRIMVDHEGRLLDSVSMPQVMTSWGLMYRFLRAQMPDVHYHHGYTLSRLEQDQGTVTAHFDNGEAVTADWLIGADGSRSTVRQQVAPGIPLNYCGYFAWRGLVAESLLSPAMLAAVSHRMLFCLPPGEHILGYLVAGPHDNLTPGQRWYNWVWYRPASESGVLRDHLTDAGGLFYPHGIPHGMIRPELIAAMQRDARAMLPPYFQEPVLATPQPFIQPIHDLGSERLRCGRVMLIGDAAFTARPHIGLGVSKAADDAAKLAQAFAAPARDAALADWETERLRFGHAALAHSRDMGCYLQGPPADEETRIKGEYHRRPEVLLARVAAADPHRFLHL